MADRVKWLAAGLTLLVTALVVLALLSIKPRDPRRNKLQLINIAKLERGRFAIEDGESFRYFIIHRDDGGLYVLAAPLVDGEVPMPEAYWWQPSMKCKQFGLDPNDGVVRSTSTFLCRDLGQPPDRATRWRWDINGHHVPDHSNTPIADLYRVRIERSRDEVVLLALEN